MKSLLHLPAVFASAFVAFASEAPSPPIGQPLPVPSAGLVPSPGFTSLSPSATGLVFTNLLQPLTAAENQIRLNGSGVAAGDADGDGNVDLFFSGLETGSRLFRNLGEWRFEDITHAAGLASIHRFASGCALADLDGDNDLDLLVNDTEGGTSLFINDGTARFAPRNDAGLLRSGGATSLAIADVDGDGDLDLYVANYRASTIRTTGFSVLTFNGRRMIRPEDRDRLEYLPDGRILEHGEPDVLYLNDGSARFAAVPWTAGRFVDSKGLPLPRPPFDWSLSALFRDLNGDRAPELYVCGDFHSPDHLWINNGSGNFRAAAPSALRSTSTFSMGADFADINRDGHDDLFVADMLDPRHEFRLAQSLGFLAAPGDYESVTNQPQVGRNVLQLARGDGTFAEIAYYAGLQASGWTWSPAFLDVDLDGLDDLLLTTGQMFDTQDLDANARIEAGGPYRREMIPRKLLSYPPLHSRCLAFRNTDGLRFQEVSEAWGVADYIGVSQGMCLADLDNDGDFDLAINRLNGPAGLYRNNASAPRIAIRLRGLPPNTRGIGARLILSAPGLPAQSQEISAGGRYLSSDDPLRSFAVPADTSSSSSSSAAAPPAHDLRLEVLWRSGKRSLLHPLAPNHLYLVDEASAAASSASSNPPVSLPPTLFLDQSARLGHTHFESPFDDFERQPLLPRRLSQAGPGVAWIDLNRDRRPDLVLASGRGGRPGFYLNAGDGAFQRVESPPAPRDLTALAPWPQPDGSCLVLASSSAYEDPPNSAASTSTTSPPAGLLAADASGLFRLALPLPGASPGPLALGDLDGDGDLELFVGGHALAGRYPLASPSRLFEHRDGQWLPLPHFDPLLANLGLINAALWADLNADGFPELILASEWGPIRLFLNRRGTLLDATADWGLDRLSGWWSALHVADFDGDGLLDLVAANWGLNSKYQPSPLHPRRLYHGDLAGIGHLDLIEAAFDPLSNRWVPERDLFAMARQLPDLPARFPLHRLYAQASVDDLLGPRSHHAHILEAHSLASTLFLNRSQRLLPTPLPPPAQFSPVFGLGVADWNGDGHCDLFLAQNFFATPPATSRSDAGRGLLLLGDGRAGFLPLDASRSGIAVYGEQRGCAVADYDADGRPDLLLAQNAGPTHLFRNQSARPAVRLRLQGPPGNPFAYGALVHWRTPDGLRSPSFTVLAGSGYLSADDPVLLIPPPPRPALLHLLWPGGKSSSLAILPSHSSLTAFAP